MNLENIIQETENHLKLQNVLRDKAIVTLIKLKEGMTFKEHSSKSKALLVLLSGEVNYNEANRKVSLRIVHDFVEIPEHVPHSLTGIKNAQLLLIQ